MTVRDVSAVITPEYRLHSGCYLTNVIEGRSIEVFSQNFASYPIH